MDWLSKKKPLLQYHSFSRRTHSVGFLGTKAAELPPVSNTSHRALVVLPASTPPSSTTPSRMEVGGLTVLVRCLLTLNQAGILETTVLTEGPRESVEAEIRGDARLESVRVASIAESPEWRASARGDVLLVFADRVFSPSLIDALLREALPEGGCVSVRDERRRFLGLACCRVPSAEPGRPASTDPREWIEWLERLGPASTIRPAKGEFGEKVRTREDAARAEERLMQGLVKETDSFLARRVHRPVSLFITRRLARTRITPNRTTLIHAAVGLLGAVLFAQPVVWAQVLGSLLFLFSSMVDGCDGEIARLKFQQSGLGGWLDLWADNVVHVAVFAGIAVGLHRQAPADRFLWLGGLSCLGVLLSAGIVSWKILRRKSGKGNLFVSVDEGPDPTEPDAGRTGAGWIRDIDDFLARRDFIYVLVPLAALGKLEWFLWASAVGGNLFFLSLLVLYARR